MNRPDCPIGDYCIFHQVPRYSNAVSATILSAIEADRWKGLISLSLFSFYLHRDSISDDERLRQELMSVYNRTLKMKMHNMICQSLNRVNFEPISPPSYRRTLTQFRHYVC